MNRSALMILFLAGPQTTSPTWSHGGADDKPAQQQASGHAGTAPAFGEPGDARAVTHTISIETSDCGRFAPDTVKFK